MLPLLTRTFQCYCRTTNFTSAIIFRKVRPANLRLKPFILNSFSARGMADSAPFSKVRSSEVPENMPESGDPGTESCEHDDNGGEEGDTRTGPVVVMTGLSHEATSPASHFAGLDKVALEKYSYLAKGYSTEIYKIELKNLPIRIGYQVTIMRLR